jgi:enamine deaminase RidA (YjgF/YER057c/UK114 family)
MNMNGRILAISLFLFLFGITGWIQLQIEERKGGENFVERQQTNLRFINRAPAGYSHVVVAQGGRTLYISGQVAADKNGNLVGRGDFRAQVKQVFENLKARLAEGGATFNDVAKINIYLTGAPDLAVLREIRNSYINTENPPASTLVVVKQLAREEYLIEIEAIAVVSE